MGSISSNEYKDVMKVLMDIKGDIGGIKEHLKNINGCVARHERDIAELKKFVYKCMGGLAIGVVVLQGILMSGSAA